MSSSKPTLAPIPTPNPIIKRLEPLVGTWDTVLTAPNDPPTVIDGIWTTFEWMEGGFFLIWRSGPMRPDFPGGLLPASHSLLGYDEETQQFIMYYFDSRGVHRVLYMHIEHNKWELSRKSPGFSQRFIGTISEDGNTITGAWERSSDDVNWNHDFEVKHTKVK